MLMAPRPCSLKAVLISPGSSSSSATMIQAVMVISTLGKPRLLKFYNFQDPEKHQELVRSVFQLLSARPEGVSNFVQTDAIFGPLIKKEQQRWRLLLRRSASDLGSGVVHATQGAGPPSPGVARGRPRVQRYKLLEEGTKLVYKHLATLYFVFVFDSSENELAMLDLVQVFVETLNKCFKNVCELDIVFNFNKLHTVLDEMILGGQVIETSSEEIMRSVEETARLEKQSSTTSLIPKSISQRFSR